MKKRLYLSRTDKKLAGVCGGIADYLDVDSTIVRLLWVIFTILPSGAGLLLYIVAAIVMTEDPRGKSTKQKSKVVEVEAEVEIIDEENSEFYQNVDGMEKEDLFDEVKKSEINKNDKSRGNQRESVLIGGILVIVGTFLFSRNFFSWHWINFKLLIPLILIGAGISVLIRERK